MALWSTCSPYIHSIDYDGKGNYCAVLFDALKNLKRSRLKPLVNIGILAFRSYSESFFQGHIILILFHCVSKRATFWLVCLSWGVWAPFTFALVHGSYFNLVINRFYTDVLFLYDLFLHSYKILYTEKTYFVILS